MEIQFDKGGMFFFTRFNPFIEQSLHILFYRRTIYMMNKDLYVGELVNALSEAFPNAEITRTTVNAVDVIKDAIIIRKGDVSPMFYVDDVIGSDVADVVDFVRRMIIAEPKPPFVSDIDGEQLYKENLFMELINTDANRELLNTIPHREIEDLSIIYKIKVDYKNGMASAVVTNDMMRYAGETEEDLWNRQRTTELFPPKIYNMSDIDPIMGESPFLIISNEKGVNGAVNIVFPEVLDAVCDRFKEDELFIIPSSIHECLAFPASMIEDSAFLIDMVRSANAAEVSPEERLSSNIYTYTKGGQIKGIATDKAAIL